MKIRLRTAEYGQFWSEWVFGGSKKTVFPPKVGALIVPGDNANIYQGSYLTNANETRRRTVLCRLVVRNYAHDYRKIQTQGTYRKEMPQTRLNLATFWPFLS